MALQWQAPFEINPNAETPQQRSLAQLNQTISGIGNQALQYRQQNIDNQRQAQLMKLRQAQEDREQRASNYEYGDPNAPDSASGGGYGGSGGITSPMPTGSLQQGSTGPQPNMSMDTGEQGYAAPGSTMPQALHAPGTDLTAHFMNWQQQGQPMTYDHPEMSGGGAAPQSSGPNPNDPFGLGVDIRRVGLKGYTLMHQEAQAGAGARVLGASPMAKSIFGNASPQDLELSGVNAGETIPKLAELQASMNYKNATLGMAGQRLGLENEKFGDTQLEQAQKAYSTDENVKKAQGTLDKVNQAIPLLQSGQIDNATAKQALVTAMTYMSTGGQRVNDVELKQFGGAQALTNRMGQWLKGIDAGTLTPRDARDMTQVLGYFQRSAQQNLQDAGMRYGRQLSQRTHETPENAYKRVTGSDFTSGQGGGGQGGGQPMTAVNRKTGQRIQSTDGGKTWTVAQ